VEEESSKAVSLGEILGKALQCLLDLGSSSQLSKLAGLLTLMLHSHWPRTVLTPGRGAEKLQSNARHPEQVSKETLQCSF
jgi:hypothetical protein